MSALSVLNLQQSSLTGALAGFWKLAPERAVTLNPKQAGVLRVAQGQVWVTLDGPHQGPANDWGDVVLQPGEQLRLMPGQHAVVEPFGDAVNEPVYFSWEPATARALLAPAQEPAWRDVLAHPELDPRDDEMMVSVRAFGRVLRRLSLALQYLIAGRGRVLSPLESNQP